MALGSGNETSEQGAELVQRLHNAATALDESAGAANISIDSTPHASPGNGEADQAGSFCFESLPEPLTTDQLVDKLAEKGLEIGEAERPHIAAALEDFGYYRLRGYWMTMESEKRFLPGVTFHDVEEAHALDSELRHWLLDMIEPAEVKLRSQLSNHLALAHGADAFYSPEPFLSAPQWEDSMKAAKRDIRRAKDEGKPSVCHNLERFGKLPTWSLVDNVSLGTLSKLFGNLKKGEVPDAVCASFGVRFHYLKSWFELLTYVRNLSAHDDRFYNRVMKKRAALLKEDRPYASPKQFPTFLVIRQLYLRNWPEVWKGRREELVAIFGAHPAVDLGPMGFPENWEELLG